MLFIKNFPYGRELDDSVGSFVEYGAFLLGVFGVAEGDEEAALSAAFASNADGRLGE